MKDGTKIDGVVRMTCPDEIDHLPLRDHQGHQTKGKVKIGRASGMQTQKALQMQASSRTGA
jgi:hypothetical protein